MGDLVVTVRLHGQVVEDRVVAVRRAVRLGDTPYATVSFPGADLLVVRTDAGLLVRGRTLAEGEDVQLALGHVDVTLTHAAPEGWSPGQSGWTQRFDTRFLLCALLVAALGTWMDAAEAWLEARAQPGGPPAVIQVLDQLRQGEVPTATAGP